MLQGMGSEGTITINVAEDAVFVDSYQQHTAEGKTLVLLVAGSMPFDFLDRLCLRSLRARENLIKYY